jgi:hypothetical protein
MATPGANLLKWLSSHPLSLAEMVRLPKAAILSALHPESIEALS